MSAVVGVDLSSRAIDLVKLDETTNRAEWVRCELRGKDAWERTLNISDVRHQGYHGRRSGFWWDDVYLVAIEAPYGRGQAGTQAILNRVVGAVAASLPARLRSPERCWLVRPAEVRAGLGLPMRGKPTHSETARFGLNGNDWLEKAPQDALDALLLAFWARQENAKGVAA